MKQRLRSIAAIAAIASAAGLIGMSSAATAQAPAGGLSKQVEIIRTAHGVPHIRAENLRAAGYALGWLQLEDYGARAAMMTLRSRGGMGNLYGHDSIEGDFANRARHSRAAATYNQLEQPTRDVYEGFAAGMNRYIELHPEEFPANMPKDFVGVDIATRDIGGDDVRLNRIMSRLDPHAPRDTTAQQTGESEDGSNAWAFAPSRTKSGHAILLRNPHLAWTAGYYEAQMTVPGVIDFYGDFRIGGPFNQVGGFNRYLGFSTTNNSPELGEVYALDVDTSATDHYLFDGKSIALTREPVTVEFKNGNGFSSETREFWSTPLGPVIYRGNGKIYVVKEGSAGQFRGGEQMLHMMRAKSLAEWRNAMRMRARSTSNFTYADHAGNIFYQYNASLPDLPHPKGGDSTVFEAHGMRDVWTRLVPYDSLPHVLNPKGGYIHNENGSPHFTNVREKIDTTNAYSSFEKPRLSLRGQLAIETIDNDKKLSLEDVIRMKHTYKMLLADRVKPDLLKVLKPVLATDDFAEAAALLEKWDNNARADSKGAILFERWWQIYSQRAGRSGRLQRYPDSLLYAKVWSAAEPTTTPRGLADPARAKAAFDSLIKESPFTGLSWGAAWGDVHRVRQGTVDVPVGGCSNDMGCFRVLNFAKAADGKLAASGGDGWILAVEFDDVPRAYSLLAYGESAKPDSPWHSDQAEMFANGQMKRVAFRPREVDANPVVRYRPGEHR
ncbi:MAG: penicillin acylase family protein [Gemmatimonadaceae bacterium]